MDFSTRLFQPGLVVATPGVLLELSRTGQGFFEFLDRHTAGDYGEVSDEQRCVNTFSLITGETIVSAYRTGSGAPLSVVTDLRRRTTCIFLPDEIQFDLKGANSCQEES